MGVKINYFLKATILYIAALIRLLVTIVSLMIIVSIRVRPYLFPENLVIIAVHFLDLLQELGGGVAEGGHDGPDLPEPLGDIGHHGATVSGGSDLIVQGARLSVNVAILKVR